MTVRSSVMERRKKMRIFRNFVDENEKMWHFWVCFAVFSIQAINRHPTSTFEAEISDSL